MGSVDLEFLRNRRAELRSQPFVDVGDKGVVVLCCRLLARESLLRERSGWRTAIPYVVVLQLLEASISRGKATTCSG